MDKGELNNIVFQDPVGQGDEACQCRLSDGQEGTQSESAERCHLDSLPESHQGELQIIHEMSPRLTTCLDWFRSTLRRLRFPSLPGENMLRNFVAFFF
jgi:hypothetical protein